MRKREVRDKYLIRHRLDAEPETRDRMLQNIRFSADAALWARLKSELPDSMGEAVQAILDAKGISQEELAMRLGCSRAAWRKWCAKPRISLRHVVAMCIALDLRADLGIELVRLSGLRFMNRKEDHLLLAMIYETRELTVARANEIMRQEALPPLTEGQDEELSECY